jgi:hypothetical protein
VLSTGWLSYDDILELKGVEEMTEVYYNSRQFTQTLHLMEQLFPGPYQMFLELWKYYTEEKIADISHSRVARYEILFRFLEMRADSETLENLRDQLMIDLYLRENSKKRPFFAREQGAYKDKLRAYAKEAGKTAHLEVLQDGTVVLFDYEKRDPLTKNAGIRFFAEEKPEKEKR